MPSELYYPSGAFSLNIDTYKTGSVLTPNNLTIWTPAAGKTIVLFGFHIYVGAAGATTTTFKVNTTNFLSAHVPSLGTTTIVFESGLRYFSPDDVLKISMPSALTIAYNVWGTEI